MRVSDVKISACLSALLGLGLLALPAWADGYPAVPLYSGGKTVMDEQIAYPATGPAHVNAMIVTIAPGQKTELHKHGVPLYVYVLEGDVTVAYEGHGERTYKQGESFLEAMNVAHKGLNNGSTPAKLLAVYIGAEGSQDVIKLP